VDNRLADVGEPSAEGLEPAARRPRGRWIAILIASVASLAFPGLSRAASLSVVPNGPAGVAVTVDGGGVTNPPCTALAIKATSCTYNLHRGARITLSATINQFVGWSDVRCPPTPSCTLSLDQESTTIAASYAVQRIWVRTTGAGTVAAVGGNPALSIPTTRPQPTAACSRRDRE
jgi:hypothetical protein